MEALTFYNQARQALAQAARIDEVKTLPLARYRELPNVSAVYTVWYEPRCLYVGMTRHLRQRWQQHHRRGQLVQLYPDAMVLWLSASPGRLPVLERQLIQALAPKLNGRDLVRQRNGQPTIDQATMMRWFATIGTPENDRAFWEIFGL